MKKKTPATRSLGKFLGPQLEAHQSRTDPRGRWWTNKAFDAIEAMLDVYETTWTDPRVAALVIATALRPVVPIPCRSPIFISGPSSTERSWTATAIMGFWQAYPGAWNPDDLPGGPADSLYVTENAVSRVPIWVSDDPTPAGSMQRVKAAETKLSEIILWVARGEAKRRTFADGSLKASLTPRAVFIATAENPLSLERVMSRVAHLRTTKNFMVGIDALDTLVSNTHTLPTITGWVICEAARKIEMNGWMSDCDRWRALAENAKGKAKNAFSTDNQADRPAKIAADTALGLFILMSSLDGLRRNSPERADVIMDRLLPMENAIYSLVGECHGHQLQ